MNLKQRIERIEKKLGRSNSNLATALQRALKKKKMGSTPLEEPFIYKSPEQLLKERIMRAIKRLEEFRGGDGQSTS